MFDIGIPEFLVLAVAALFIFGPDRLPDIARQAARGIRTVRAMAQNARRELTKELGPEFEDFDINDLNPRTFVKKRLLNDLDEDDLRFDKDLDIRDAFRDDDTASTNGKNGHTDELDSAVVTDDTAADLTADAASETEAAAASTTRTKTRPLNGRVPFDPEAT
ncbi:sec-independent translocase [Tenggerimyces flavus]|uniref:Sec-independent protein translocase protein TatB n=1 Tax=Tenggerimyces flavus TaxID=1708749 RepID=A0ABV7YH68_9ACTN|nr:sec-independent translocase [Tenggerimyces flavus]MBM7786025.1 sec-independent protein translocase protein TatB [Tenggerimyces flavus]